MTPFNLFFFFFLFFKNFLIKRKKICLKKKKTFNAANSINTPRPSNLSNAEIFFINNNAEIFTFSNAYSIQPTPPQSKFKNNELDQLEMMNANNTNNTNTPVSI